MELDNLPTEIISEVFVHCDYITLNLKLRLVCHRFNIIIQNASGPLLKTLFRLYYQPNSMEKPVKPLYERNRVCYDRTREGYYLTLHPCIKSIKLLTKPDDPKVCFSPQQVEFYFENNRVGFIIGKDFVPLCSTPVRNEDAFAGADEGAPLRLSDFFARTPPPEAPFVIKGTPKPETMSVEGLIRSILTDRFKKRSVGEV